MSKVEGTNMVVTVADNKLFASVAEVIESCLKPKSAKDIKPSAQIFKGFDVVTAKAPIAGRIHVAQGRNGEMVEVGGNSVMSDDVYRVALCLDQEKDQWLLLAHAPTYGSEWDTLHLVNALKDVSAGILGMYGIQEVAAPAVNNNKGEDKMNKTVSAVEALKARAEAAKTTDVKAGGKNVDVKTPPRITNGVGRRTEAIERPTITLDFDPKAGVDAGVFDESPIGVNTNKGMRWYQIHQPNAFVPGNERVDLSEVTDENINEALGFIPVGYRNAAGEVITYASLTFHAAPEWMQKQYGCEVYVNLNTQFKPMPIGVLYDFDDKGMKVVLKGLMRAAEIPGEDGAEAETKFFFRTFGMDVRHQAQIMSFAHKKVEEFLTWKKTNRQ